MVEQAQLEELDCGLVPVTDRWFVVNVRDAAWETNARLGAICAFEGESAPFADLGINLRVLRPGTRGLYHAEATQENFLVLAGQCLLLIEGEERALTTWDFVRKQQARLPLVVARRKRNQRLCGQPEAAHLIDSVRKHSLAEKQLAAVNEVVSECSRDALRLRAERALDRFVEWTAWERRGRPGSDSHASPREGRP